MRERGEQQSLKPTLATRFPSLMNETGFDADVYMFTDDISLSIMPIGGRSSKRKEFSVEFQGETADCERAKKIVGELAQFDRFDAVQMTCDAVENIARHLAWEGQTVFEILKDGDHLYFNSVTTKNLFKLFNWYLQIIPHSDWDLWGRKLSVVTKNKVWVVEIPQQLGGSYGYKKILRKLKKYDYLGPKFHRHYLHSGQTAKDFDFMKYVTSARVYTNKVTQTWGWNRRDYTQDKCTEFYSFHKMLRFRYAQAILREHILEEINLLLNRLSINSKLVVVGLPTAREIIQIRNDMQKGELSFSEALDKVSV